MSDERRFGPSSPFSRKPDGEADPQGKSVTSSRARNRTVMLTPEMTGQVRALLYNEEGVGDAQQGQPSDPLADIVGGGPGAGWSRPERSDPAQTQGPSAPSIQEFGPLPGFDSPPSSVNASSGLPGSGFSSPVSAQPQAHAGGLANSLSGSLGGRGVMFGAPNIQQPQSPISPPPSSGGFTSPMTPLSQAPRKERGGTRRFLMEGGVPSSELSAPQPAPTEPRRVATGKVIGFLVSFDNDENGECFDIRSGRLLITCRPTDQGDFILINHETISPLHAIIRATKEGKVEVLDQLSEYGTGVIRSGETEELEVAGSRVVLNHGDLLRFGERRFVICLVPSVALAAKRPAPSAGDHEESLSE